MPSLPFNSPFLLGFDQIERVLERVSKAAGDGYPPYNIEQLGPDRLRITLAVAGFKRCDLQVTLEDNQLVIRGKRQEGESRVFLYRGIAARQFQRSFVLAEGMEVDTAELSHGLLHIDLVRPQPNIAVKAINIVDSEGAAGESQARAALTGKKAEAGAAD